MSKYLFVYDKVGIPNLAIIDCDLTSGILRMVTTISYEI